MTFIDLHLLLAEDAVVCPRYRRALREGGVVLADTPFMQQVHEGAYDFTRFTESGHRYLFRDFVEVESGQVAGAGTSLRWSTSSSTPGTRSTAPAASTSSDARAGRR